MADELSCSLSNIDYLRTLTEAPEFEASPAAPAAQAPNVAQGPAAEHTAGSGDTVVASLVGRFSKTELPIYPAGSAPTPAGSALDIAQHCVGQIIGAGVDVSRASALLTVSPILAGASAATGMLKAIECVVDRLDAAERRDAISRAAKACDAGGGIATGVVNDHVICLEPPAPTP
jgi:hypothetical protein